MQDTGHELQPSSSSSSGDAGTQNEDDASLTTPSVPVFASYSLAADELTCPPSPQPASTSPPSSPVLSSPDPPQDPWYPFLSKVHMQLCLLYHGSHRYWTISSANTILFRWTPLLRRKMSSSPNENLNLKDHIQYCLTPLPVFRKNVDQVTLQCFMDILKSYVREEEDGYFPHFEEVVNFKYSFWEDKIFQKVKLMQQKMINVNIFFSEKLGWKHFG